MRGGFFTPNSTPPPALKGADEVLLKRARHVITEIKRTTEAADALRAGDFEEPIMYGVMLEGWTLRFYSAYREATTGFCIALFICCYFPRTLLTRVCSLYRRRFPPKRRLLTVEEFNEPGAR
ncbi:hypothetical protein pipiens_016637 [Culex pipiens pipiens]|uniref:Uncharacterized protein n=1 Tax=Culex pipiens pipiens TaxID=38569 RepID=A0ABD1CKE4_CULPP